MGSELTIIYIKSAYQCVCAVSASISPQHLSRRHVSRYTGLFRIVEEELIAVVGQMCHGEWDVGVDYVKSDVDKRAAADSTLHIPPKTVQTVSVSRMLELFTGLIETALRSRPIYLLLCALASACVIGIALNQRFSAYSGGDLTYFLDRTREILAHQDPYATTVAGLRV